MSHQALEDIAFYFEGKTKPILERYGPGPRVHYHTGLVESPRQRVRRSLSCAGRWSRGKKSTLREAAVAWSASQSLSGQVLDVGCGLGGGSIFWAQEFGARVTAVTCAPSHTDHVAHFAEQAEARATGRNGGL